MRPEYQYKLEYEGGGATHIVDNRILTLREALRKARKLSNELAPEMTVRVWRSVIVRRETGVIQTVYSDKVVWEKSREVRMHQRRGHYQNRSPRLSR